MRFKIEKIKVSLECSMKDKKEVDTLIDKLVNKPGYHSEHARNIPGNYKFVKLNYCNSDLKLALSDKVEGSTTERCSYALHLPANPNNVLRVLSSKPIYKFITHCRVNLVSDVPRDKELMSEGYVIDFLQSLQNTGGLKLNLDTSFVVFNLDVPAKRLKLLFSDEGLKVNAGLNGLYRFKAEFNYKGENFCIGLINKLSQRGLATKGSRFGNGEDHVEEEQ